MNQEILNLIEMAVADGEITEKERGIILRKAETLGEDKDEVEMILEGKLAMIKKQAKPDVEKAGNVTKCPQCKAVVPSFTTRCESCGHEFRNVEAVSSIKAFFEKLEKIEATRKEDSGFSINPLANMSKLSGDSKLIGQKKELILSFPIPNSKEDILEFLALSIPRAKVPGMFATGPDVVERKEIAKAFLQKCEQIIMKASFSFKGDEATLNEIRYYAKELNIKMK